MYYENSLGKLYNGNCLEVMKKLPDNSITSIITDPPYALEFMGKGWDKVLPSVEIWKECLRVAKPGAMMLTFGGTRTYHRLTCAIEDAGWEIRDCIMWVYGSGFPKSTNISKQIDKRRATNDVIRPWLKSLGDRKEIAKASNVTVRQVDHWLGDNKTPCPQTLTEKRFVLLCKHFNTIPVWADEMFACVGEKLGEITHSRSGGSDFAKIPGAKSKSKTMSLFDSATEQAKTWDGYGTGLKPAYEPIVLAMKPLDGTFAENVLKWGVGGLDIDGSRVGTGERPLRETHELRSDVEYNGNSLCGRKDGSLKSSKAVGTTNQGRWPANLIHDGSEEVMGLFPDTKSGAMKKPYKYTNTGTSMGKPTGETRQIHDANSGSAARFFYCAKASRSEKNTGCENINPKQRDESRKEGNPGGDNPRNRGVNKVNNNHPTVKPLSLIKYLINFISPPKNAIILDPFLGSGTTAVACEEIGEINWIGIEMEEEYCKISKHRISHISKTNEKEKKIEKKKEDVVNAFFK